VARTPSPVSFTSPPRKRRTSARTTALQLHDLRPPDLLGVVAGERRHAKALAVHEQGRRLDRGERWAHVHGEGSFVPPEGLVGRAQQPLAAPQPSAEPGVPPPRWGRPGPESAPPPPRSPQLRRVRFRSSLGESRGKVNRPGFFGDPV
jgi:hypothetical protein